jgi:hypothetical protein
VRLSGAHSVSPAPAGNVRKPAPQAGFGILVTSIAAPANRPHQRGRPDAVTWNRVAPNGKIDRQSLFTHDPGLRLVKLLPDVAGLVPIIALVDSQRPGNLARLGRACQVSCRRRT